MVAWLALAFSLAAFACGAMVLAVFLYFGRRYGPELQQAKEMAGMLASAFTPPSEE